MSKQTKLLKKLRELDKLWEEIGEGYMLFSQVTSLVLVNYLTGEQVDSFPHIPTDGGDPDEIEIDGKTYLSQYLGDVGDGHKRRTNE